MYNVNLYFSTAIRSVIIPHHSSQKKEKKEYIGMRNREWEMDGDGNGKRITNETSAFVRLLS